MHVIDARRAYVSRFCVIFSCVCVRVVASDLPHCPLLVGDRFVDVAVGDQMAN